MKRKLLKLNEFPDIYDVKILKMICINYRSLNVGQERKVSAKVFWSVSTKIRMYALVNT